MDLGRTARYGTIGAVGVTLGGLGTAWVARMAWADSITPEVGTRSVAIIWVMGTMLTVLFLFLVVGAFVDRELEARGLDDREE